LNQFSNWSVDLGKTSHQSLRAYLWRHYPISGKILMWRIESKYYPLKMRIGRISPIGRKNLLRKGSRLFRI
jgi:hypothetical protein